MITQIPDKDKAKALEKFTGAAPDEKKVVQKAAKKETKQQIVMTFNTRLLEQIDQIAAQRDQSRAAIIRMGMYDAITRGIFKD